MQIHMCQTWFISRMVKNGNLRRMCSYKNNKKHGLYKKWSKNGKLKSFEYYDNGIAIDNKNI